MTVNWSMVSTLIEQVGAVVLVVSLLYVAVQIKQDTKAALASPRQGLLAAGLGPVTDSITRGIFSTQRAKRILDFYTGNPDFMKMLRDKAGEAIAAARPAG